MKKKKIDELADAVTLLLKEHLDVKSGQEVPTAKYRETLFQVLDLVERKPRLSPLEADLIKLPKARLLKLASSVGIDKLSVEDEEPTQVARSIVQAYGAAPKERAEVIISDMYAAQGQIYTYTFDCLPSAEEMRVFFHKQQSRDIFLVKAASNISLSPVATLGMVQKNGDYLLTYSFMTTSRPQLSNRSTLQSFRMQRSVQLMILHEKGVVQAHGSENECERVKAAFMRDLRELNHTCQLEKISLNSVELNRLLTVINGSLTDEEIYNRNGDEDGIGRQRTTMDPRWANGQGDLRKAPGYKPIPIGYEGLCHEADQALHLRTSWVMHS